MKRDSKSDHAVLFGIALALLVVFPAQAQWTMNPPPVDSPYWWTLSDSISPAELRTGLQSRKHSRERMRDAIAKGVHEPVSNARLQQLSLHVDGSLTPELIPMFDAFRIFAGGCDGDGPPNWEASSRRSLSEFAVSNDGADNVITTACNYLSQVDGIVADIGQDSLEFAEKVLEPATARVGKSRAAEAIKNRDVAELSQRSGVARSRVADLYESWQRDPLAEAGIEALTHLRATMSEDDWESLRSLLLKKVAPTMSLDYFGERPLR